MGIHDRDWYRERPSESDKPKKAGPFSFGRGRVDAQDVRYRPSGQRARSGPPEPHEWPTWAIVIVWISVFAFAAFCADLYIKARRARANVQPQQIQLPDCAAVTNGPCIKRGPVKPSV